MSTNVCTIPVDSSADVLGKGIRVNFYYTMLLLAVIPRTPNTEELLNSLYANAGISGFGLLLTAIVQTAQHQLSLFEAIFILHILFFLGTGVSPMSKYHWTRSRVAMGVLVQFISVFAFLGWGLYVWIHVNNFGSHPQCNDQFKYVIFFVTVKATEPWLRGLWIAALVLSAVGLMISFGANAMVLFAMKRVEEEERAEEETNSVTPTGTPGTQPHAEKETSEKQWYFHVSIPLLLSAIYATVTLELTVKRNENGHGGIVKVDNSWAFGQVLPVVMIFVNINEIIHFFFGFFARRKLRLARERQAQSGETAYQAEGRSAPFFSREPSGSDVSGLDQSQNKPPSGYKLQNLNKRNATVSETIVVSNLQSQHQPIGTLR